MPDWLRDMRAVEADTSQEPAFEAGEVDLAPGEVPDWLREVQPAEAEASAEPAFEAGEVDLAPGEVPDWLREMTPVEGEEVEASAEPAFEAGEGDLAPDEVPDWLRDVEPAEVGAFAEPAFEAGEVDLAPGEVPDWLRDVEPAEVEASTEPAFEAGEVDLVPGEVPDWLRDVEPAEVEASAEPAFEAGEVDLASGEVPDWLSEMTPVEDEEVEAAALVGAEAELIPGEMPDWLRDVQPAEGEEAEEGAPEGVETQLAPGDMPDWLRDMQPAKGEEVEEGAPAGTEAELAPGEMPDWLTAESSAVEGQPEAPATGVEEPEQPEAPPELAQIEPSQVEVYDWAQGMLHSEAAEGEGGRAEVAWEQELGAEPEEFAGPAELPDWLLEIAPQAESGPSAQPVSLEPGDVPAWLLEMAPSDESLGRPLDVTTAEQAAEEALGLPPAVRVEGRGPELAELAPAEIPEWLDAMRPQGDEGIAGEVGPLEVAGVLSGLSGVLPLAASATITPEFAPLPTMETSEASLARAQLLQGLVTQRPEAAQPRAREADHRVAQRVLRALVVLVMGVVVTGVLLVPYFVRPLPSLVQLPTSLPAADRAHDAIGALAPGDTVLVAVEYQPGQSDELHTVAAPVLRDVLAQDAMIQFVSTRPEGQALGVALLENLLADTQADEDDALPYDAPAEGYQPGDAAGVARILQAQPPPGLIVVLVAQPAPMRWWVEQATARYSGSVPLVMVTSAALEPVASPYLDVSAAQIQGAISGLPDAAYYESLTTAGSGRGSWTLHALAAAQLAAVGLMLLGAVISVFGGRRRT
jgi:hypothetical protein